MRTKISLSSCNTCKACNYRCKSCFACIHDGFLSLSGIHGCLNREPCEKVRCGDCSFTRADVDDYKHSMVDYSKERAMFTYKATPTCISVYGTKDMNSWCGFCTCYYFEDFSAMSKHGYRNCKIHLSYATDCFSDIMNGRVSWRSCDSGLNLYGDNAQKLKHAMKSRRSDAHKISHVNIGRRVEFSLRMTDRVNESEIYDTMKMFGVQRYMFGDTDTLMITTLADEAELPMEISRKRKRVGNAGGAKRRVRTDDGALSEDEVVALLSLDSIGSEDGNEEEDAMEAVPEGIAVEGIYPA